MSKYLVLALFATVLVTGCASEDPRRMPNYHGVMPSSDAKLGPMKAYDPSSYTGPRPKADVPTAGDPIASMITLDASARAEAATTGTSYLLGELIAHRLHTVILGTSLEDQSACAIIRPTGASCVNIQEEQSVVALGLAHPNG